MDGVRPSLLAIQGPEQLLQEFARARVERCWHDDPEKRPTFAGEILFLCSVTHAMTFINTSR